MAADVLHRTLGDHFAAKASRAGAQIDDVVGRLDGLFVVLDDDDRVAQVAETAQRGQQALVVPLMQADAGLVQDVEHAHEP